MIFSEKLRILRTEVDMTAKELAQQIGYTTNTIYDWEKGRCEPPYNILIKLATIFNVSVPYLLGIEDDFGNVTVAGASSELTPEEQTLLANYRKLNNVERRTVYDTAQLLASKSSSAKNIV